jgi:NADH-quinone oxidoreductase subunit G
MTPIYVCVGSGCHLKGSYDIIHLFKAAINHHKLESKIELKASFCLGTCMAGVTIKVGEKVITNVSKDRFEHIFNDTILPLIHEA